mmetsp:Transcript_29839/g.44045  ORF Transcript_29839/g.44045 Transcript_29839/m.44045 type:complete len:111 (-) Transcript_29839:894-1226(-)
MQFQFVALQLPTTSYKQATSCLLFMILLSPEYVLKQSLIHQSATLKINWLWRGLTQTPPVASSIPLRDYDETVGTTGPALLACLTTSKQPPQKEINLTLDPWNMPVLVLN